MFIFIEFYQSLWHVFLLRFDDMFVEDVIIIVRITQRITFQQVIGININQFLFQSFICFPSIEMLCLSEL